MTGRCSATVDKPGECPVIAADEVSICTAVAEECLGDSEGCEGIDKCCPTACGGTKCQSPEYSEFCNNRSFISVYYYGVLSGERVGLHVELRQEV